MCWPVSRSPYCSCSIKERQVGRSPCESVSAEENIRTPFLKFSPVRMLTLDPWTWLEKNQFHTIFSCLRWINYKRTEWGPCIFRTWGIYDSLRPISPSLPGPLEGLIKSSDCHRWVFADRCLSWPLICSKGGKRTQSSLTKKNILFICSLSYLKNIQPNV